MLDKYSQDVQLPVDPKHAEKRLLDPLATPLAARPSFSDDAESLVLSDSNSDKSSFDVVEDQEDHFEELIADIKAILGPSSGLDSKDVDVKELMNRIAMYDETLEHEWSKYAFADASRNYTRNGVDGINSKANLLILVWNPSKGSLIHDHANAHCIVKVLKGEITEVLYRTPEKPCCEGDDHHSHEVEEIKTTKFKAGQVSYMSDEIGLHRMVNQSPTDVAVTLHLYTPPYASKFGCHIYDQHTGKSQLVNISNLYSDKGVVLSHKADSC